MLDKEEKQAIAEVAKEVYEDGLKSSIKPIGRILSYFPRTLRIWLSKWEKWIVNAETNIELTLKATQEKLSNLDENKITDPEPYVFIPAIEQLAYSFDCDELREMYANLLVSSANIDTKDNVHPGFVDVIKQLSPNDAKILNMLFASGEDCFPIIQVNAGKKTKDNFKFNTIITFANHEIYLICNDFEKVIFSINNLCRLGLLSINYLETIAETDVYDAQEKAPEIVDIKNSFEAANTDVEIKFARKLVEVTEFGKRFMSICCSKDGTADAH